MKIFTRNTVLFKKNKYIEELNPSINLIEDCSKVSEFKTILETYNFHNCSIICFDNKKLVKWLTKQPNMGFFAGQIFEPRKETSSFFDTNCRIMWVPPSMTAWSDPENYEDDWRYINEILTGRFSKHQAEFVTVNIEELYSIDTTIDIETTGINYATDLIRSIGFAWVGKDNKKYKTAVNWNTVNQSKLKKYLVSDIKKVFHNATFDLTFLCRDLNIHPLDIKNIVDTRIKAYCKYNSAKGSDNSLEFLARRTQGTWKIDCLKATGETLLHYNANDCAATLYLDETIEEVAFTKKLHELIPKIVGMQLVGWPLNRIKTLNLSTKLEKERNRLLLEITKTYPGLNPNSSKQLSELFFKAWKLPSFDKTSSGGEKTGRDALEYFITQTDDPYKLKILNLIKDFKEVDKVKGSFIEPMLNAVKHDCFLRGSYLIGGTKSGRLSANNPNLQQFPSHSKYAKQFKECFQPPKGWVIIGADYKSLEDRVSALTTRDPEKLKVYTDGFDGHSLRAAQYWDLPNDGSVESINRIAELYPDERQRGKGPTFALTYQGTIITLIKRCGFSPPEAKKIYDRFHKLYSASDIWVNNKLQQGKKHGYVDIAFGHRIKTPLLKNSVLGKQSPYQAQKEFRTAANALGQSYCMITGFTSAKMYKEVKELGLEKDILPIGEIHDSVFNLVRDDEKIIKKTVELMQKHLPNHECKELEHPTIKLEIDAFIIRKSWAEPEKI